jgi:hypothetical protein
MKTLTWKHSRRDRDTWSQKAGSIQVTAFNKGYWKHRTYFSSLHNQSGYLTHHAVVLTGEGHGPQHDNTVWGVASRLWISIGWDYVSELLPLADVLFIPRWYECGERRWNDILTGESRRTRRKSCPSATLSTTNPTRILRKVTGCGVSGKGSTPGRSRNFLFVIIYWPDLRLVHTAHHAGVSLQAQYGLNVKLLICMPA